MRRASDILRHNSSHESWGGFDISGRQFDAANGSTNHAAMGDGQFKIHIPQGGHRCLGDHRRGFQTAGDRKSKAAGPPVGGPSSNPEKTHHLRKFSGAAAAQQTGDDQQPGERAAGLGDGGPGEGG